MIISKPELRNLHEQTYWYLQQQIITNKLKPGSKINYDQLSDELGMSKTPLRDAFNRLSQEGLVEIKPRSGTFVCIPNLKDAIEVYDIRKALERQSVALSMGRIPKAVLKELLELNDEVEKRFLENGDSKSFLESDRKIHQTIIKYSNNFRIINIMDTLNAQFSLFGYRIINNLRKRVVEAVGHHKDILKAMLDENEELAQRLMENHIEETKLIVIKDFLSS